MENIDKWGLYIFCKFGMQRSMHPWNGHCWYVIEMVLLTSGSIPTVHHMKLEELSAQISKLLQYSGCLIWIIMY